MDGIQAARTFTSVRFPGCNSALLFGSVARGDVSPRSDLDVLVVMPHDVKPYRESYDEYGWFIEVWVVSRRYAEATVRRPVQNQNPVALTAYAEGLILKDEEDFAQTLQEKARAILNEGPPPLTSQDIDTYRYVMTDWLDDFLDASEYDQAVLIAHDLTVKAAEFIVALHGHWIGERRWLYRALQGLDHPLAGQLMEKLVGFYKTGNKDGLVSHIEAILALRGGRLYEGYHQSIDG